MALHDFRARLEHLFAEYTRRPDPRAYTAGLKDALVELKVALQSLQEALGATERERAVERRHLTDAERRGQLALGIGDQDTADIAKQFAEKHRQRVELLERKLAVQRDEIAIAQRDHEELANRYRAARQGMPPSGAPAAGPDEEDADLLRARLDRQATEAAVDAQLEQLKKKLGKQ